VGGVKGVPEVEEMRWLDRADTVFLTKESKKAMRL